MEFEECSYNVLEHYDVDWGFPSIPSHMLDGIYHNRDSYGFEEIKKE